MIKLSYYTCKTNKSFRVNIQVRCIALYTMVRCNALQTEVITCSRLSVNFFLSSSSWKQSLVEALFLDQNDRLESSCGTSVLYTFRSSEGNCECNDFMFRKSTANHLRAKFSLFKTLCFLEMTYDPFYFSQDLEV